MQIKGPYSAHGRMAGGRGQGPSVPDSLQWGSRRARTHGDGQGLSALGRVHGQHGYTIIPRRGLALVFGPLIFIGILDLHGDAVGWGAIRVCHEYLWGQVEGTEVDPEVGPVPGAGLGVTGPPCVSP